MVANVWKNKLLWAAVLPQQGEAEWDQEVEVKVYW